MHLMCLIPCILECEILFKRLSLIHSQSTYASLTMLKYKLSILKSALEFKNKKFISSQFAVNKTFH